MQYGLMPCPAKQVATCNLHGHLAIWSFPKEDKGPQAAPGDLRGQEQNLMEEFRKSMHARQDATCNLPGQKNY